MVMVFTAISILAMIFILGMSAERKRFNLSEPLKIVSVSTAWVFGGLVVGQYLIKVKGTRKSKCLSAGINPAIS